MKNRKAILFFLAWSAVFALALAFLSFGPQDTVNVAQETLSALDAEKISGIEIERRSLDSARERIVISRTGGKWRLESPIAADADDDTMKGIIDAIVFAEPSDELSGSDMALMGRTLGDFGLADPQCTATIRQEDSSETYSFGRPTAAGDGVYASMNGRGGVFIVNATLLRNLMRPIGELRRRKLFSFAKQDVVGIGLKKAGEPFTKLSKTDGTWRITEPMETPADRLVAEELVSALCSASVIDYAAGIAANAALGDDEGYALTLFDSYGAVEKVVFGGASGTNMVWILNPDGAPARIDAEICRLCKKCHKTLEDTRVFPVDASSVIAITISKGFPAYNLSRAGTASWHIVSPVDAPADAAMVEKLLANVLALRSADIASAESSGHLMVSVGTASTNFPNRAVQDISMPDDMRLEDLRDKLLIKCPREKLKRINMRTAAGVEWDATRSEAMIKLLEGGIIAERVETMMPRDADLERCGLKLPSFTMTCELDDSDSPVRKLLLGAAAPGGGRYAIIGGAEAALVLSATTVSSITRPVGTAVDATEKPTSAAR